MAISLHTWPNIFRNLTSKGPFGLNPELSLQKRKLRWRVSKTRSYRLTDQKEANVVKIAIFLPLFVDTRGSRLHTLPKQTFWMLRICFSGIDTWFPWCVAGKLSMPPLNFGRESMSGPWSRRNTKQMSKWVARSGGLSYVSAERIKSPFNFGRQRSNGLH